MFNKSGIEKVSGVSRNQILANVELQSSVGCIVVQAVGVSVAGKSIAKAGTPVKIDLMDRDTVHAVLADATTNAMTGVLLHDVDVTDGNANGQVLIFGFVNVNRVDADVATKITAALTNAAASKLVTFMRA